MQKPAIFVFCPGPFQFLACVAASSRRGGSSLVSPPAHTRCQGSGGSPLPGGKVPNPFLQDALSTFSPNQG